MKYSKMVLSTIVLVLAFSLLFSTVGTAIEPISTSIAVYMIVGYVGSQMAVTAAMNPAVQQTVYTSATAVSNALASLPSKLQPSVNQALLAISTQEQRRQAVKTFDDATDAADLISDVATSPFRTLPVRGIQDYRSYIVDKNVSLAGGKVCRESYGLEECEQPDVWKIFVGESETRDTIEVPWSYECIVLTPFAD